jgi:hypothetical protein
VAFPGSVSACCRPAGALRLVVAGFRPVVAFRLAAAADGAAGFRAMGAAAV